MDKIHDITEVVISNGVLKIKVDGKTIRHPLKKISQRLAQASDIELNMFTISPSGYGIHWPLIDEDISINGLMGIKMKPGRKQAIHQRTNRYL